VYPILTRPSAANAPFRLPLLSLRIIVKSKQFCGRRDVYTKSDKRVSPLNKVRIPCICDVGRVHIALSIRNRSCDVALCVCLSIPPYQPSYRPTQDDSPEQHIGYRGQRTFWSFCPTADTLLLVLLYAINQSIMLQRHAVHYSRPILG